MNVGIYNDLELARWMSKYRMTFMKKNLRKLHYETLSKPERKMTKVKTVVNIYSFNIHI